MGDAGNVVCSVPFCCYKTKKTFRYVCMLQTLTGNADSDTVVKRELQTFTAKMIRFRPQAWSGRITMRVEVFGCLAGKIRKNGPTQIAVEFYSQL